MLYYLKLCYANLNYVILCYTMLYDVIRCYTMVYYVILCNASIIYAGATCMPFTYIYIYISFTFMIMWMNCHDSPSCSLTQDPHQVINLWSRWEGRRSGRKAWLFAADSDGKWRKVTEKSPCFFKSWTSDIYLNDHEIMKIAKLS